LKFNEFNIVKIKPGGFKVDPEIFSLNIKFNLLDPSNFVTGWNPPNYYLLGDPHIILLVDFANQLGHS